MTSETPKRQSGSEIVKALEDVWAEIVRRHPELPDVVMITGSGLDGMGGRWAHFWRERWEDKGDTTKRPELFVAGERLACGAELTVQSILHEAAHALAYVRDEKDTSRQNRYHNKVFLAMAKELGLDYVHEAPDKTIGFSAVTLTEAAKVNYKDVIDNLDQAILTYLNDPMIALLTGTTGAGGGSGSDGNHRIGVRKPKTTGKSRNNGKYVCGCETPRILRMAPKTFELAAVTCGECGQDFREAE